MPQRPHTGFGPPTLDRRRAIWMSLVVLVVVGCAANDDTASTAASTSVPAPSTLDLRGDVGACAGDVGRNVEHVVASGDDGTGDDRAVAGSRMAFLRRHRSSTADRSRSR